MSRWIRSTKDDEWAHLFTSYERSAYRLEGQQMYSSPKEDVHLAEFLAGRPVDFDLTWRLPKTQAQIAAGRTKTTVRILIEPPTAYTRLELSVYPQLVDAGEDIRIIAAPQGQRPLELPLHDYWLFDERDVWKMHYYENFRFAGAELLDAPAEISEHLRWRDLALALAVPLHDYLTDREHDQESTRA